MSLLICSTIPGNSQSSAYACICLGLSLLFHRSISSHCASTTLPSVLYNTFLYLIGQICQLIRVLFIYSHFTCEKTKTRDVTPQAILLVTGRAKLVCIMAHTQPLNSTSLNDNHIQITLALPADSFRLSSLLFLCLAKGR